MKTNLITISADENYQNLELGIRLYGCDTKTVRNVIGLLMRAVNELTDVLGGCSNCEEDVKKLRNGIENLSDEERDRMVKDIKQTISNYIN